jgi:hypothetical protein
VASGARRPNFERKRWLTLRHPCQTSGKLPALACRNPHSRSGISSRELRRTQDQSLRMLSLLCLERSCQLLSEMTAAMTALGTMFPACLPVKWAGLTVPNPASAAEASCEQASAPCADLLLPRLGQLSRHRSASISKTQVSHFRGKTELKLCNRAKCETEMSTLASKLSCDDCRTTLGGQETGQWLSTLPSAASGEELSAAEFVMLQGTDPGPAISLRWLQPTAQHLSRT